MIKNFVLFWINNAKITFIFIIIFIIFGVFSWFIIPKQYNPDIVIPAFNIFIPAPGYNSSQIQNLVIKPLENKLNEIEGVEHIYSYASRDYGVVTISFYVGTDKEKAISRLYNKIYNNIDLKPIGVLDPIIKSFDPDEIPIYTFAVVGDKTFEELRKIAVDIIDKIRYIKNISNIYLVGGHEDNVVVEVDIKLLEAKNIDFMQIYNAIKSNNLVFPGGSIKIGDNQEKIIIEGSLNTIDKLKNLVIGNYSGLIVTLGEVAKIYRGIPREKYFTFFYNGKQVQNAVYIGLAKKKGSNSVFVVQDIKNTLEKLELPSGVSIQEVQNEGKTAKEATDMLLINLIQSVIIVFFVLWIYLGFKDAINNSFAIPLAIAGTIGLALLIGDNINRITLFALILVLGMLVDNGTIVVENIARHMSLRGKTGKTKLDAILDAVEEVGMGVILSTITRILSFVAMFFVTGMMGQYMGPIPKYAIISLTLSLLIAFSVNPFLAYYLYKDFNLEDKKDNNLLSSGIHDIKKTFIEKIYYNFMNILFESKLKRKIFKISFWIILLILIILPPSLQIFKARMLPKSNKEQIYIWIDAPRNYNINKTLEVYKDLNNFLSCYFENSNCNVNKDLKIIKSISYWIGLSPVPDFSNLFRGSMQRDGENYLSLRVNLIPIGDRKITSEEFTIKIRPHLKKYILDKYPDLKIRLLEDPPGPPVRATFMLKIQGSPDEDIEKLESISKWIYDKILPILKNQKVVDVYINDEAYQNSYYIKINHELVNRFGLDINQVVYSIYGLVNGLKVSINYDNSKEPNNIILIGNKEQIETDFIFNNLYFTNKEGRKIPLSEISEIITDNYDRSIYFDDKYKTVYIYGEMGDNSVVYPVINIFKEFLNEKFWEGSFKLISRNPYGFIIKDVKTGKEYKIMRGGEWELTMDTFRDLGLAMIIALIGIYLINVIQFKSFVIGGIIMMTFLLGLFGIMPGYTILYLLKNEYFSATSMIGMIALAGIVVGNAIVLIDYLNILLSRGITLKMALLHAGTTRLRPIILTSLTTVLGAATIIGDPVWSGLAWSIIWGLFISSILTLIVIPVFLYDYLSKFYK